MGNGIAHVFALAEWSVTLVDVGTDELDRALATIRKNMDRQVKKDLVAADARDAAIGRIHTATELEAARPLEPSYGAIRVQVR